MGCLSALRTAFCTLGSTAILATGLYAETPAQEYRKRLTSLDVTNAESTCEARDTLRTLMGSEPQATQRAMMFRDFRSFYLTAVSATNASFYAAMKPLSGAVELWFMNSTAADPLKDLQSVRPEVRQVVAPWIQCGFSITEGEGDLYPAQNPSTLLEFADKLPADLQSYIKFRGSEDAQPVAADACLALTWDQLRMRMERWEAFARSHPDLPETKTEVVPEIPRLAEAYFFGMDNTPTYDDKTGLLDPKLLESWKNLATQNTDSRYHSLIANLLLRMENGKPEITDEDRDLFRQAGLEEAFNTWRRNYKMRTGVQ